MKTPRRWKLKLFVLLLLLGGYSAWALLRPLAEIAPAQSVKQLQTATPTSKLAWPAGSQAAVGIIGTNILETSGTQTPIAMASTAKIVTCLMVLQKSPLKPGQTGPSITITPEDIARYKAYVAQDGSVLPVQAGEQLSQYQMLQAVMLPSANNIADSLAIWAYGSLPAYSKAANEYLAKHGLKDTKIGSDASGLGADSTSTASDLLKLGKLAMSNPVIAEIVGQKTADSFPLGTTSGTIKNVNYLLGTDGIIGVKTGNSDHVGGAFVGAATVKVNGQTQVIITAVTNAPTLAAAMTQSRALIKSAQANFQPVTAVKKGQTVGYYQQPWGGKINAVADADLKVEAWQGSNASSTVKLNPIKVDTGQAVGKVVYSSKQVSVKLNENPTKPSPAWRLTHPLP